jgi:hypothetical protein
LVRRRQSLDGAEEFVVDVRVPSLEEIAENPKRCSFIGGGWVDSDKPNLINLYWHVHRRKHFTVYSLLNVLEHETLHAVLAWRLSLQFSMKLDRVHRSSCVCLNKDKLVFVNEFKIGRKWVLPPYFEEPTANMLE